MPIYLSPDRTGSDRPPGRYRCRPLTSHRPSRARIRSVRPRQLIVDSGGDDQPRGGRAAGRGKERAIGGIPPRSSDPRHRERPADSAAHLQLKLLHRSRCMQAAATFWPGAKARETDGRDVGMLNRTVPTRAAPVTRFSTPLGGQRDAECRPARVDPGPPRAYHHGVAIARAGAIFRPDRDREIQGVIRPTTPAARVISISMPGRTEAAIRRHSPAKNAKIYGACSCAHAFRQRLAFLALNSRPNSSLRQDFVEAFFRMS